VFTGTYGPTNVYEYATLAGFRIAAGLRSRGGIKTSFSVSLVLQSRIDTHLKDLPSFDRRLAGAEVWAEDLIISTGGSNPIVRYAFPRIEFEGIDSYYTNAQQYHLIHFAYRTGLAPGPGKSADIPAIQITNRAKPTVEGKQARSRGSLALNAEGANEAPILSVQPHQKKENTSVVQVVTERCSHARGQEADTGWLNLILAQNRRCSDEDQPVDLAFKLNGHIYRCDPPELGNDDPTKCGLSYLHWEERYGLALNLPLPSPLALSRLPEPPDDLPTPDQLVPDLSALRAFGDLGDGDTRVPYLDRAVEVCSIVSGTDAARRFDWRSPRQVPQAR
jgi:hypothetical protein